MAAKTSQRPFRFRFFNLVAAIFLPFLDVAGATADSLSQLPPAWQGRLTAVPEADISGAEASAQLSISQARNAVAQSLDQPTAEGLAAAYGHLGGLYQVYGIISAAEPSYANARQLAPQEFRWPYYAGQLALQAGRPEQALKRFAAAEAIGPEYPPLHLRKAQAEYDLSRFQAARQRFESLLTEPGLRPLALYYLGQIDLLERDYPQAIRRFQEALRLDPQADAVHYPLAQALHGAGATKLARDHLTRKGSRLPQAEDPLLRELEALDKGSRPHFLKAVAAIKRREYDAAVAAFQEGLALDPDNVAARISLARALFLAGRPDQSRQELARVHDLSPENTLANFLLGILSDAAGDSAQAQTYYRAALRSDPGHAGAHFFLANLLLRSGSYRDAADHYERATEANPDIGVARLYRLVALQLAGDPERKIRDGLETLVAESPDDPAALYALARLLAASEVPEVRDARQALQLAEALAQSAPLPFHLEALALAQAANGDFEAAISQLQRLQAQLGWMAPPGESERLKQILADYQQGRIPGPVWRPRDPLLTPGPVDAYGPFEEYPTAIPY